MFFACFSCGVWYEAQQRYASTVISYCQLSILHHQFSIDEFRAKLIFNYQLSIINCQLPWPNGGGVKRSTERSVKKSRLIEPKASFPRF